MSDVSQEPPRESASGAEGEGAAGNAPRAKASPPLVGVQLRRAGRLLLAAPGRFPVRRGDRVVVEAEHGTDVATVMLPHASRPGLRPTMRILRPAEERDEARAKANDAKAKDALELARELARTRHLPMKFFRVEVSPSAGRTLFYFAAEARVDFRDIVRELAGQIRGRIELRQVGARDEAKMIGGIGSCGQELCCSTFLPKFAPVSIRMAKDQGLALAPSKVSGQCGRLKCCLVYEQAHYVEAARRLPKIGKRVATPEGPGRVGDLDVLHGRVRVTFEDRPPKVFEAEQVTLAQPMAEGAEGARSDGGRGEPSRGEHGRAEGERRPPHGRGQTGGSEPRRGERRGEPDAQSPHRRDEAPPRHVTSRTSDAETQLPEDDQPDEHVASENAAAAHVAAAHAAAERPATGPAVSERASAEPTTPGEPDGPDEPES